MGLTFIDFFSGIGGFRLGMEMTGHECVGHCEIDKFANKSYKAMHQLNAIQLRELYQMNLKRAQRFIKNTPTKEGEWFANDITRVSPGELPEADCWCFGFPCQDISIAGKQRGFAGDRSGLFFTTTRLIRDLKEENRPKYLFIENVKNFLSINGGYDFLKAQIELDEIGYDVQWQLLNSKNFGVPQNRERVFFIGHLRGQRRPEIFPIRGTNGETLKELIAGSMGQRVYDPSGVSKTLCGEGGGQGAKTGLYMVTDDEPGRSKRIKKDITPALRSQGGGDSPGIWVPVEVRPVLTPDREEKRQNGRRIKEDGEPMFTLTAQDRHGVAIYQTPRGKNIGGLKDIAPTLSANCYEHNNHLVEGAKIRRLTPKECFRLQGFPDEYFERARAVNSDSQLYKQAGNSVSVPVIYAIASRLGRW